ncbi:MAG: hypothetical protein Q8O67_22330 [Deltaproteobacteria bacterium]|nr:hypothetical protein [Deltaproteobacteria bacterium]
MILLVCAWALAAQVEELPAEEAEEAAEDVVVVVEPVHELDAWIAACLREAPANIEAARLCLRTVISDRETSEVDRADAVAAEAMLQRLDRHLHPPVVTAPPIAPPPAPRPFAAGGHVEAGLNGALFGGLIGFTGAAGVLSGLRTSDDEALPWLLSAPALGLVIGASAGVGAVEFFDASDDDVAFVSSSGWAGTALGLTLQLSIFADSRDVQAAPLRFFTTLGGSVLGLGLGLGLAPFLDVESGDAALANSGLAWGSVLSAMALGSVRGAGLDAAGITVVVGGGGLLTWGALIAVHQLLSLHRVSTWLIDLGGVLGFMGGAVLGGIAGVASGGVLFLPVWTLGTATGIALGVASAFVVDDAARRAFAPPAPLAFSPAFFPTREGYAPGVSVQVARW